MSTSATRIAPTVDALGDHIAEQGSIGVENVIHGDEYIVLRDMMMTAPPVAAPEAATLTVSTEGSGLRCIHCGQVWPGHPWPYMHSFTVSETEPMMFCNCGNDLSRETWHAFEVSNTHGCIVAGMVCPRCATTPGLEAVVAWAGTQVIHANEN
jgi:hypothetical protein